MPDLAPSLVAASWQWLVAGALLSGVLAGVLIGINLALIVRKDRH